MCVYSMIADNFFDRWPKQPAVQPWTAPNTSLPFLPTAPQYDGPTKKQMEELLDLLRVAKKYDTAMGQPDCELEEKKKLLRDLAHRIGVTVEIP